MKNQRQSITEFVKSSSEEGLIDMIQGLLLGLRAGVNGMKGESWLGFGKKPSSKKEAISGALSYCEVVNQEASRKIFSPKEEKDLAIGSRVTFGNQKVAGKIIGSTRIFPSWAPEKGHIEYIIELDKGAYLKDETGLYISIVAISPDIVKPE